MTNRQQVEQAIREACPELKDAIESEGRNGCIIEDGPIHLEHVLRAIRDCQKAVHLFPSGDLVAQYYGMATYNLSLPFAEQSDELINFLHKILCAKE